MSAREKRLSLTQGGVTSASWLFRKVGESVQCRLEVEEGLGHEVAAA